MPQVGFEPTTRVFESVNTVHDFDSTAIVIGEIISRLAVMVVNSQKSKIIDHTIINTDT
jgi:hypothetical protein